MYTTLWHCARCFFCEMVWKYCVTVMWSAVLLGENKVPFMSAVRFIKLLFQYKQPDAFTELAREMLQLLSVSSTQGIYCYSYYSENWNTFHLYQFSLVYSFVSSLSLMCVVSLNDLECGCLFVSPCQGVEGQSFRKAEMEIALLDGLNSLLSSQRNCPKQDNMIDGKKS